MDATISIETKPFTFNIRHILLIVAIAVIAFILSHYYIVRHTSETQAMKFEDVSSIAEEIYSSGTIEAATRLPLDAAMAKKLADELEGILRKTIDFPGCEVYVLQVIEPKEYPILIYGNMTLGTVYLSFGEIWKVGMTKNGQVGRYPNEIFIDNKDLNIKLDGNDLRYKVVFSGTFKQALINEKILIYTYHLWSGHPQLLKPPGCKIFR